MPWSDEDTAAYWDEVRREEASDRFRLWFGRGGVDPLAPGGAVARIQAVPAWPVDLDPPTDEDEPVARPVVDWRGVFVRALSMLPRKHHEVLTLAYLREGSRGGRSGDGVHCARMLGCSQPRWVARLDAAEQDLAVVAPWARDGWDRGRVIASCPWPDVAAAYLDTWSTLGAARMLGCPQPRVWSQVGRGGPVLAAIRARPNRR